MGHLGTFLSQLILAASLDAIKSGRLTGWHKERYQIIVLQVAVEDMARAEL